MARKAASSPATALDGLNPWVRAVAVVGAPTAGLAVLIYGLFIYLPQIATELKTVGADAAVMHESYKAHLTDEARQSERLLAVIQRVCLNTSRTDEDRLACVAVGPK